ncbi:PTS hybrid protein [Cricetibacter osteomyelitidis]|uniref:phosphoenolpyruvate--glycerone phosphotransferase n=1 Tax=Cricetibacter osteomyelitidis TaxID=1521931 RepID=A0A4R2TEX4_9PAST|nr:dihydroxyacetone kinase phosphoryl donor subunit DhaM [Cricetibacter osteomyelitidis]TCP95728.1 PTS hybrid protein [Cricetibacter osteomyelitidis]
MINFVIVSHSAKLAEGVVELAFQMKGDCKIVAAGGIDDEINPIGTDATKIMQAIEDVFDDDGVIVMVDLGSAILSAETAIELLDPSIASKVRLCLAPLVEGTIGAVVAAASGDNIDEVLQEASLAYEAKLQMH